ncbi:hypothetical protein KAR91_13340 [Candidatus Pacearchaeota archaeon]|nr:hypothetical protein [Candidatus Pacearchaeota archaeon]
MGEEKAIDCDYTDEVVCPHCGHKHDCSYESFDSRDETVKFNCEECEEDFNATMGMELYYSSKKIKTTKQR